MQQEEIWQNKYKEAASTVSHWVTRYLDAPYKHLGDNLETGIDCINLCLLVYKEQLGIDLSLGDKSYTYCDIIDENWYRKTNEQLFDNLKNPKYNLVEVDNLKPFDILTLSIGSTNVTNHAALFLGQSKILQTMIDHRSWVAPYGKWYKRYTVGRYRWKHFNI